MKTDQSILERIRKLLALAEGNQNQHEREASMQLALDLLAKHNLTTGEVQSAALEAVVSEIEGNFRLDPWVRNVLSAVCTLYYTAFYTSRRYQSPHTFRDVPVFVGTPDNIAVTLEMASWLLNSIRKESNRSYKLPYERKSFRLGAADKLLQRALQLIAAEKVPRAETTGTSLMVIRDKLEHANQEHLATLNLRPFRNRASYVHPDAYDQGEEFAAKVQLSRQKATSGETQHLPNLPAKE